MNRQSKWMYLVVMLIFMGCYEDKEGCLDPNAVNFDVAADKDCCCQYPELTLEVSMKVNDSTFLNLETVYVDTEGHPYRIKGISFYASHLELVDESSQTIDVRDSSELWVYAGAGLSEKTLVANSVFLIKHNQPTYKIGSFSRPGGYRGVKLNMGLDEHQNLVIPDSIVGENPLGFRSDSLWAGPGIYVQQQWIIETDTSQASPKIDTFQVLMGNNGVELAYSTLLVVPQGANYELKLVVDIEKWLDLVEWQADKADILQKLRKNSANALSLVQ